MKNMRHLVGIISLTPISGMMTMGRRDRDVVNITSILLYKGYQINANDRP